MYRESQTAVRTRTDKKPAFLMVWLGGLFLLGYFMFLPILLAIVVNWAVYVFTANNLYTEYWMMPGLLILSTFLSGALIRQKMEDESGGMGLLVLAVIALLAFSWLTYYDISTTGGVYSRFMPKLLRHSILDYIYVLPGIGLAGMLFYKYFTLKHYS